MHGMRPIQVVQPPFTFALLCFFGHFAYSELEGQMHRPYVFVSMFAPTTAILFVLKILFPTPFHQSVKRPERRLHRGLSKKAEVRVTIDRYADMQ